VLLAGARSWDPGEEAFAAHVGIRAFSIDELSDAAALIAAVTETGAQSVYLHIDLDVLDPGEIAGLLDPEPFGLAASTLVSTIKAMRESFTLAGATVAAYAPASPAQTVDDAPTLLRIIGALAS